MAMGAKLQLEPGSLMETLYDIYIGIVVGANHSFYIVSRWWYLNLFRPILLAFGIDWGVFEAKTAAAGTKETLKVVAVGYGRTGTYSLMLALDELGFPCLHTQHLYEHNEIISMWTNEVFTPAVKANHASMGKPDFQLIVDHGFTATADLPMALYFDQIAEQYPDCKFILTTRDNSEVWFRSWDTLTKSITQPTHLGAWFFTNVRQYSLYLRWLFSVVNKDDSYLTAKLPLPDQNREAAIASYEEHNKRVRELIPADRLLEYNVKQGWEPLCQFLNIAQCPDTPFPKTNSARSVQVQAISATIIPLVIVLFILFTAFAKFFQKATNQTVLQWTNCRSKQLLRKVLLGEKVVYVPSKKQKL
ncbi:hypothetical protein FisN_14Hh025 [Fistulifera solaris]|uniref:NAD dependent epimerase/dehydratase n=1 Tax=Fistulifera solaris TaxID=1519565 RepID=A0A1Z5K8D4_FISSO|nr:hypothetical protein FisN_14Hh025 [Fistulifera solaris]|eukprot:GAX22412.1 hypothetical protein FisN_14Hh025 [Fistulifera solaris]